MALETDAGKLQQVLTNLVGNAIKFTSDGSVTVNIEVAGDKPGCGRIMRFEVVDTGIGISEDIQEKLFDRFVQADGSTSRQFGGTGLGLAICRELVTLLGGNIGCVSALGRGSTFWFELPLKHVNAIREDVPSTVAV